MSKTELTRLHGRSRGAIVAWLTALLVAVPVASAVAEDKGAAPAPSNAQPTPPAAPPAAPPAQPPAAAPPAQPTTTLPTPPPGSTTITRTEIYGNVVKATKDFKKKIATEATVLSLVSTSSEPVAVGSRGLLMYRKEEPGKPAAWIEVAEVALKKHEAGGKMVLTIALIKDTSAILKDAKGKPVDPFAAKTKIKLQFDRFS
jgi:hypothetical protein